MTSGRLSCTGAFRGFKAYLLKLERSILHDRLPPDKVALGWAIGMFYGCVVPFGFQLIISIPTAVALKASKIGASVGTLITNPFTIWVLYPVQCFAANRLIGGGLSYNAVSEAMNRLIEHQDYGTLFSLGRELVVSFFLGGAILAAVCVPLTYFIVKRTVIRYRGRRV